MDKLHQLWEQETREGTTFCFHRSFTNQRIPSGGFPSTLLYAIPQLRVSPPAGIKSKSNVPALLEMEMNQNVTLDSGRTTAASFRKVERMLDRRQRGAAAAKD